MNVSRWLISILAALTISQVAWAERIALVIGNADFQKSVDLPQTAADASAMGSKLQSLGFRLIGGKAHVNLTRAEMLRQVRALGREANDGDEVVFYFSGHGIGGTQTNYLLPVNDGEIEAREDVPDLAVDVASVLDRLPKSAKGINIVILDACRDNPLPSRAKSAYAEKGLARISNAASNTVFLYAAKPGEQAYVSPAGRSYFTDALLSKIDAPGQNLSELIYSVQQRVLGETSAKPVPQTPWFEGVAKPYYFRAHSPSAVPKTMPQISTPKRLIGTEYEGTWNFQYNGKNGQLEAEIRQTALGEVLVATGAFALQHSTRGKPFDATFVSVGRLFGPILRFRVLFYGSDESLNSLIEEMDEEGWWSDEEDGVGWLQMNASKNEGIGSIYYSNEGGDGVLIVHFQRGE